MFGFLNINKSMYRTSREAVNAVQRLVRPIKVGHAGTLDPLATGVLVVGVGPATRLTKYVQQMPKTYVAGFRFGIESDTEDITGKLSDFPNSQPVDRETLESVLAEFTGEISQLPPKFSALKVKGKRAYDLARRGEQFELKPRPVTIHEISLQEFQYPDFQLKICCGSGTYIRSLGRDIGVRLSAGAVMTRLERTAIGNFEIEKSLSFDDISLEMIEQNLVTPQSGLGSMQLIQVPDEQIDRFVNGHAWQPPAAISDEELGAVNSTGNLLAVLKRRTPDAYTPGINFSKYWLSQLPNR